MEKKLIPDSSAYLLIHQKRKWKLLTIIPNYLIFNHPGWQKSLTDSMTIRESRLQMVKENEVFIMTYSAKSRSTLLWYCNVLSLSLSPLSSFGYDFFLRSFFFHHMYRLPAYLICVCTILCLGCSPMSSSVCTCTCAKSRSGLIATALKVLRFIGHGRP